MPTPVDAKELVRRLRAAGLRRPRPSTRLRREQDQLGRRRCAAPPPPTTTGRRRSGRAGRARAAPSRIRARPARNSGSGTWAYSARTRGGVRSRTARGSPASTARSASQSTAPLPSPGADVVRRGQQDEPDHLVAPAAPGSPSSVEHARGRARRWPASFSRRSAGSYTASWKNAAKSHGVGVRRGARLGASRARRRGRAPPPGGRGRGSGGAARPSGRGARRRENSSVRAGTDERRQRLSSSTGRAASTRCSAIQASVTRRRHRCGLPCAIARRRRTARRLTHAVTGVTVVMHVAHWPVTSR